MPDGRVIAYKRRRFLPPARAHAVLIETALAQGERLDLLTARTMGDPEQFWRVCDANNAMTPDELEEDRGRLLIVPLPQA
jgi:hypothetical protein